MAQIRISQLKGDEMLKVMYPLNAYAFRPSPPLFDKEDWMNAVQGRKGVIYFALFENDIPVAGVASSSMTQMVRGKRYPMGGIWGVATHPGFRRKGYSRQLMSEQLSALREAGIPLSGLYPFRESFYERLGYVTFPQSLKAIFPTAALNTLVKRDLEGNVKIQPIAEAFEIYQEFLRMIQKNIHGMALFDFPDKARVQDTNAWWIAMARVDGDLEGLMLYDLRGENVTKFTLRALRFYYRSGQGKYLLLQWISRHIDQAEGVEIWLPPYEHPGTWLADIRPSFEPAFFAPMGRILDVANIGGMTVGAGRFSARINDPICPWNEGIWSFDSQDGVLQIRRSDRPDCDLNIRGLAALVYGTHNPDEFSLRAWGNPSKELQEIMREMFPPKIPHLHEMF